jgi:hypothetical protein
VNINLLRSVSGTAAVIALGTVVSGCSSSPSDSALVAPCQSAHFEAHAGSGGSLMSQPWEIIAVTNEGPRCSIEGYPRLTSALGHSPQGSDGQIPIEVGDGPDYEHPDPGPHYLILRHTQAASFALGSDTASGAVYVVTELAIALPSSPSHPIEVAVDTVASAATGRPIHLQVTALTRGSTGPPAG